MEEHQRLQKELYRCENLVREAEDKLQKAVLAEKEALKELKKSIKDEMFPEACTQE